MLSVQTLGIVHYYCFYKQTTTLDYTISGNTSRHPQRERLSAQMLQIQKNSDKRPKLVPIAIFGSIFLWVRRCKHIFQNSLYCGCENKILRISKDRQHCINPSPPRPRYTSVTSDGALITWRCSLCHKIWEHIWCSGLTPNIPFHEVY